MSVLTLGEIEKGCARLDAGPRRLRLEEWLAALRRDFADRLLPVVDEVALAWGRLSAAAQKAGRPIASVDGLIAATALHRGFFVVTRNEADFAHSGVKVMNPWRG